MSPLPMHAYFVAAVLFSLAACSSSPPKVWTFHFEAEKGDQTVTIPYSPAPLQTFREKLPKVSPDPLEKDAIITKASTRTIGTFREHRVIEVALEIKEGYYTDLFMLVCETEGEQFVPIYVQQYNRVFRTPELGDFETSSSGASLNLMMNYSGTDPSSSVDRITISTSPTGMIQVRTQRDPS